MIRSLHAVHMFSICLSIQRAVNEIMEVYLVQHTSQKQVSL